MPLNSSSSQHIIDTSIKVKSYLTPFLAVQVKLASQALRVPLPCLFVKIVCLMKLEKFEVRIALAPDVK